MAKKALVIVESPAKAKTIQKYLGKDYIVKASVGHIADLPKSKLGVDLEHQFKPDYQPIPGKKKVIEELHKAADKVDLLYLATDPDREGEAIAWHISEELKKRGRKMHRILMNSITKPAVLEAIQNPKELDLDRVNAQQARRILDRLVGYKMSPLLWDKVRRGLSAGRVQSVALRLVVERNQEIKAFNSEEYWTIEAEFAAQKDRFRARYFKVDGEDPKLPSKATVDPLVKNLETLSWRITKIDKKERTRKPTPPFITSRLQQEASRKLGFSAQKTMAVAQRLYEGTDLGDLGTTGLITYMRTDSVRVEPAALTAVREFIAHQYGADFVPESPNFYKTKKSAQDAHECIRPTAMDLPPDRVKGFLERDELRLYQLIWNRFVASQMKPAVFDQTAVDVSATDAKKHEHIFRATGSVIKFAGFISVYQEDQEEKGAVAERKSTQSGDAALRDEPKDDAPDDALITLPDLSNNTDVKLNHIQPDQHFTQPPPRYTDASLVKVLEEYGIGRPSTYASILTNLQDREYVEKRENRYFPSELGIVVIELLLQSFPDVLDVDFTADLENQLDQIEEGKADWKKTLAKFWTPFEKALAVAKVQMKNLKAQEIPTDVKCEKCGSIMFIKWGRAGSFLACSKYPDCKGTADFKKDEAGVIQVIPKEYTDKKCAKCSNPMIVKGGKFGKFLACSDYPTCKSTLPYGLGVPCPTCKIGELCEKQSKYKRLFYSCSRWPDCNFALWDKPVEKPCPKCANPILTDKVTKRMGHFYKCPNKECGYTELVPETAEVALAAT